ncbi:MAG: chloride channel protein [Flavobacteriales bacterium]|nr:chloride channel protein [Flavobacteriales bacterium]
MERSHPLTTVGQVRQRYFGPQTSLIVVSVVVGCLASLGAVALKQGVHLISEAVHGVTFSEGKRAFVLIFPMVGLLLVAAITQFLLNGNLGAGLPSLVRDVRLRDGRVAKHKMWSQVVTAAITEGMGGSGGLEPPIAAAGGAFGSALAEMFRFGRAERILLLASGAGAGVGAIFNAPIAGTIFALEILLAKNALALVVPMLISSATATLVSSLLYSGQPFILITNSWNASSMPWYVLLAFIAALLSVYVIRTYRFAAQFAATHFRNVYVKAAVGGLLLGILIFFFPPLFGEGYDSVELLLKGQAAELAQHAPIMLSLGPWNIVMLTLGLTLFKVVAVSFTVHSGGNGGMFGPSLFIGAMLGFTFAHALNLSGVAQVNEVNFTVVGMAAMLSGTIHVPLTAIFLIAEITGGYALFVPLMIVTSISYLVCRYMEPISVYGTPPPTIVNSSSAPGITKDGTPEGVPPRP